VTLLLEILALMFLGIFVVVWLWIGWDLWHFTPTSNQKRLDLDDGLVTAAGFLASSVGAGPAAVLGIEIKKLTDQRRGFAASVARATLSPLIFTGVLAYAVVGGVVFALWLANRSVSPDVIQAFAFGLLGWLAGAFAAVFRAATT
jgi:hypothetical protein